MEMPDVLFSEECEKNGVSDKSCVNVSKLCREEPACSHYCEEQLNVS